jgi:hypothetical protein
MECAIPILVLAFIVIMLAHGHGKLVDATRKAYKLYLDSLNRLKRDPHNPHLRETTLALGRHYVLLLRSSHGPTTFDEVAILNDINAACARAGTIPPIVQSPTATSAPAATVEERLARLDDLLAKRAITDAEHKQKRGEILAEL